MYGDIPEGRINCSVQEQLDVWSQILGRQVDLKELITSPFRSDNTPKCYLYEYDSVVLFKDWGYPQYNKYTIWKAIQHYGYTFGEANQMIFDYINSGKPIRITYQPVKSSKRKRKDSSNIEFESYIKNGKHVFTKKVRDYLELRGITLNQLYSDGGRSVQNLWINGSLITPKEPCIALTFPDGKFKIYSPLEEDYKWMGTVDRNSIWIWNRDKKKGILTKSWKDGRIIFNNTIEYNVYSFQNEGVLPEDSIVLETFKGIEELIIIYDNDEPGINASIRICDYLSDLGLKCRREFFKSGKDADEIITINKETLNKELCEIGLL